jgi:hypothetical protein
MSKERLPSKSKVVKFLENELIKQMSFKQDDYPMDAPIIGISTRETENLINWLKSTK